MKVHDTADHVFVRDISRPRTESTRLRCNDDFELAPTNTLSKYQPSVAQPHNSQAVCTTYSISHPPLTSLRSCCEEKGSSAALMRRISFDCSTTMKLTLEWDQRHRAEPRGKKPMDVHQLFMTWGITLWTIPYGPIAPETTTTV